MRAEGEKRREGLNSTESGWLTPHSPQVGIFEERKRLRSPSRERAQERY